MLGECLAGALYWRDLYSIAKEVGFKTPCLVCASPITIGNKELEDIIGEGLIKALGSCEEPCWDSRLFRVPAQTLDTKHTKLFPAGNCCFVSATFRLFKVPANSQAGPSQAIYSGGILGHEEELVFDANFTFKVWGGTLGFPEMLSSPGL